MANDIISATNLHRARRS